MEDPPLSGTVKTMLETFLFKKLPNKTKSIKTKKTGLAIVLTDATLLGTKPVYDIALLILDMDIQDFSKHAPLRAKVLKAIKQIYQEEINDPGTHFDIDLKEIHQAREQEFVLPQSKNAGLDSLRAIWREAAYKKYKKDYPDDRPLAKRSISQVINMVFSAFPDWEEDDFLKEENEQKIHDELDQIAKKEDKIAIIANYLKITL
jgi:hypothetical protein